MQSRLLALVALCGLVVGLWSCTSMSSSNSLAMVNGKYHPKYMPAADVIRSGQKSGVVGSDRYVCGDEGCNTAVRAD